MPDKPGPHRPPQPMELYQAAVTACVFSAKYLSVFDLKWALNSIEQTESAAPTMAPGLWREKAKAMFEDKELLQAALPLWEWAKRVNEKMRQTQAKGDKPKL